MTSHPPAPPPQSAAPETEKRGTWAALVLSAMIHGGVLLLVGGYVIFEGVVPKTPFTQVDVAFDDSVDHAVMPEITEIEDLPESPVVESALGLPEAAGQPETNAPSADLIVASSVTSTFQLPAAAGPVAPVPGLGSASTIQATGKAEEKPAQVTTALRNMASFFGSSGAAEALVGTFYDPARTRKGDPIPTPKTGQLVEQFARSGGDVRKTLNDIWKSDDPLSANFLAIPRSKTQTAYEAFGVKAPEATGAMGPPFLVHYTAMLRPSEPGTYRFCGLADDYLVIAVDGKVVLAVDNEFDSPAAEERPQHKTTKSRYGWESPEPLVYIEPARAKFNTRYTMGDWITWKAGEFKRVDILVGDGGNQFRCALFVQKQGMDYPPHKAHGAPVLPLLRMSDERVKKGVLENLGFQEAGSKQQILFLSP